MKKVIWGNTIVKNEDKYIWFAIKSVINYLDKIIIWDTGSTDKTVGIIKLLQREHPNKIEFKEIGEVDSQGLTEARSQMLEQTKSDWLLLVDGDEIWWKKGVEEVVDIINTKGDKLYAIVTPVINVIGDIYHYQEKSAGQYNVLGLKGHFNLRAINRKIPGLHIKNDYPLEGFYDQEKIIQEQDSKLILMKTPILHTTHLVRSSSNSKNTLKRESKFKFEIGLKFSADFKYPDVMYYERPVIVNDPWTQMKSTYKVKAMLQTPLKKIKRKIWK